MQLFDPRYCLRYRNTTVWILVSFHLLMWVIFVRVSAKSLLDKCSLGKVYVWYVIFSNLIWILWRWWLLNIRCGALKNLVFLQGICLHLLGAKVGLNASGEDQQNIFWALLAHLFTSSFSFGEHVINFWNHKRRAQREDDLNTKRWLSIEKGPFSNLVCQKLYTCKNWLNWDNLPFHVNCQKITEVRLRPYKQFYMLLKCCQFLSSAKTT